MADTPIFKLNSNPTGANIITLPGYNKDRTQVSPFAYIQFEGRTKPTGFRSPTVHDEWTMEAIFTPPDRAIAVAFKALVSAAALALDSRFIFTPGGLQTDIADQLVEINSMHEEIDKVSGITHLTFNCVEVFS